MNRLKLFFPMLAFSAFFFVACDDNDLVAPPVPPVDPPVEEVTLKIELSEPTANSVKMTVTPSDDQTTYYFDVIRKSLFEKEHNSDWKTYVEGMIRYLTDEGKTLAEAITVITTTGVCEYEFKELHPDTEYLAVAMGINREGNISTGVECVSFATSDIVSDNLFELKILKTEYDNVEFEISPANEDPYFYSVYPKAMCDRYTDDQILERLLAENAGMIDFFLVTGKSTVTRDDNFTIWNTDTGYYILVFGYDKGVATTKLHKFEVRTSKPTTTPENVTFTFVSRDITSTGFVVDVVPSDKTVEYMWSILSEEEYEANKNNMKAFAENYVIEANLDMLDQNLSRGDEGNIFSHLTPDMEYYVWCVCMDEMGKTQAEVQCSKPIRIAATMIGESEVRISMGKYFNGDDLYALNSEKYADARGKAYVSVTFQQDEKAAMWYGTLSEEDLTSPELLSDMDIVATFESRQEYWFPTTKLYLCNWDAPYTVLAVAKDKSGNFSEVVRELHTFSRDKAAPVSEFVEPEENPVSNLLCVK